MRWGLFLLLGAQALYTAIYGTRAALIARDVAAARERYRAQAVQAQEIGGLTLPKPSGWVPLLTRHQVLAMQGLPAAAQGGQEVTPFATGLFRCAPRRGLSHDLRGLLQSGQSLILLGDHAQRPVLLRAFAPAYRAVQTGPGYVVLQPRAATPRQRP